MELEKIEKEEKQLRKKDKVPNPEPEDFNNKIHELANNIRQRVKKQQQPPRKLNKNVTL